MKKENGGISQAGRRENHRFFGLQVGKSGWKKRRHQKLSAAGAVAKVKVSFYTRKSKGDTLYLCYLLLIFFLEFRRGFVKVIFIRPRKCMDGRILQFITDFRYTFTRLKQLQCCFHFFADKVFV